MKKQLFLILVLIAFIFTNQEFTPADPEYYQMNREDIILEDFHNMLINYRGFVSPRQYSVTQF